MPVLIYFQYNENCMQSSSKAQVQIKLLNYKQHLAIHAMSCSILSQKVQLPKNSASLPFSFSSELALPYTLQTVYVISRPSLEKTDKDIIKRLRSREQICKGNEHCSAVLTDHLGTPPQGKVTKTILCPYN